MMSFPGSEKLVRNKLPNQILLLIGPPGSGKTTFIQQFIYDRLSEGNSCLYIVTDYPPRTAVENMNFLGFSVKHYIENGLLRIIDCYSGRVGMESPTPYVVKNPENLSELSIRIDEAGKGLSESCFALDSITTLAVMAGLNPTRRFLFLMLAKLRESGSMGICALELGVHETSFENFLRFNFDGVLEMKIEERDLGEFIRYFRIYSLKMARYSTAWTLIKLGRHGINIMPPHQS